MKYDCEVIRDLLPLYVDGVCSEQSRSAVEEHLSECPECNGICRRMGSNDAEQKLIAEKETVIVNHEKKVRRRGRTFGLVMSGIFAIPILACLIVNLAVGATLDWFFVVLASMLAAASVIIVPVVTEKNKFLYTLSAFVVSLVLLLAVICIYSGGQWFFIASLGALFGLSCVLLPIAVRKKPLSDLLDGKKALTVMAADSVLLVLLMLAVSFETGFAEAATSVLPLIAVAWGIFLPIRYIKSTPLKLGVLLTIAAVFAVFGEAVINLLMGGGFSLPAFSLTDWRVGVFDGTVKWITAAVCVLVALPLGLVGAFKKRGVRK